MREQIETRLGVLKQELDKGQTELQKVERQEAYLREMILRISGAIQVLEELLAQSKPAGQNGPGASEMEPAAAKTNGAKA